MNELHKQSDPVLRLDLVAHTAAVTALKFRNENELISSGKDNDLLIWHLNTKDLRTYRFSRHTAAVNDLDCSSKGKLLVSCSDDMHIQLWVPSLTGKTEQIRAHMKPVTSIQFSYDNRRLLSGAKDKCMKLWDVKTRKFLHSLLGHNHYINCARFFQDGSIAVSCAEDKTIRIWDVDNQDLIHTLTNQASTNKLSIYGKYVACAQQTGSVRIYDIIAGRMNQHYVLNENVTSVDWHPSGKFLLATCSSGFISVIDILEGRPIFRLHGLGSALTSVAFSPSGQTFACGDANNHILIWDWDALRNTTVSPPTTALHSYSD